jgi:hypothetical protein
MPFPSIPHTTSNNLASQSTHLAANNSHTLNMNSTRAIVNSNSQNSNRGIMPCRSYLNSVQITSENDNSKQNFFD